MAKEAQEFERQFIASIKQTTGHELPEWMDIIKGTGLDKQQAILKWLKESYGFKHNIANAISFIYLNDGKPAFDHELLFANLFKGKEALRPTYDAITALVQPALPEVEFVPTKTYISVEGKRVFGCATLTAKNIRFGLDLGEVPFGDYVQKAKSLGAMPNVTHMIEVNAPSDANETLLGYVRQAYDRVHKK
jgi:hypothetical protein